MDIERETRAGLEAARPPIDMTPALRQALDDYAKAEAEAWGEPTPAPPTPRFWVTKDGRAMLVAEMTSSHLLNAIAFVERNEERYRLVGLLSYLHIPEWMEPRGDGAQMAFEAEIDRMAVDELDEVMPAYRWLREEARDRNLMDYTPPEDR